MSYNIKYITSYKRRSNNTTTITISENGYNGGVTTLIADNNPLTIATSGDINNIYQPTLGSGAEIKLMVEPLTMLDLFTTEPQKYLVQIYNGTTGGTLTWQGFISTGLYSEDYSIGGTQLVPIQISCNDGMVLLDDYSYKPVESGTTTYEGSYSISEVLNIIFSKLNLTFTGITTNHNLLIVSGITNIFTGLFVNNENYIDESFEIMSCREVLNSIFQPLGLVMTFRAYNIYLIDPVNLHNTSNGKSYDATGGTESNISVGGYLDVSGTTLQWYETGQIMDIVKPYNELEINYNPYTYIGDGYEFGGDGNYSGGTFICMTGATPSYQGDYWWNSGVTYNNWIPDDGAIGEGIKETSVLNDASPIYYIKRKLRGDTDGTFTYTFPYSSIKQDDNIMLELSFDTYINTRHYINIVTPTETPTNFQELYMDNIEIKVGDKYWNQTSGKWQDSEYYNNRILVRQLDAKIDAAYRVHGTWFRKPVYYEAVDNSVINDTWTTAIIHIPLTEESGSDVSLINGSIQIKIYVGVDVTDIKSSQIGAGESDIQNILIKNVNLAIVKPDKQNITNDGVKTIVNLSTSVDRKKSPLTIQLKNGCGTYGSSKGAFSSDEITPTGTIISGLQRSGSTKTYDTAILLGQSLISEYNQPRYKLSATLDVQNYGLSIEQKLICDNKYLSGKAFYITNGNYYDSEENFQCELLEIVSTREALDTTTLTIDNESLDFYDNGDAKTVATITVTSYYTWTLECSDAWITADKAGSTGNDTITLTIDNNTGTTRNGTVVFKIDDVTYATCTINQDEYVSRSFANNTSTVTMKDDGTIVVGGTMAITATEAWYAVKGDTWFTLDVDSGSGNATSHPSYVSGTAPKTSIINYYWTSDDADTGVSTDVYLISA